jgi:PHP family Zn ribbon phosphoesterase
VPWEIAMGQPEGVENDVQVLPMVMECSISFKPIHDFAPQTGLYHYFRNSHEGVKFF